MLRLRLECIVDGLSVIICAIAKLIMYSGWSVTGNLCCFYAYNAHFNLHCGDIGYFFKAASHVSLSFYSVWKVVSFTLCGHFSLFALWGHRKTLKSVMFFSHLHYGDVGYCCNEVSHVSLSFTLWGHYSLIYTVGT